MKPLICRVELLMFPLERQEAFLPLTSDIHPQLTSLATSERALTASHGRHTSQGWLWESWYCSGSEITAFLSTCQAPIRRSRLCPTEITSDKIKLKYPDISAPICFQCFLCFPNNFCAELHLPSLDEPPLLQNNSGSGVQGVCLNSF